MINLKKRILIIEDSLVEQNIIYNALKNIYSTSVAHSGNSGIKLIKNSIPDLIILDLLMDDGDGWKVIKILRDDPTTRNLPIIVTTSCLDEEIVCFKLGASDFISKPVVPEILKERIKIHLSLQERITIDELTGAFNRNK